MKLLGCGSRQQLMEFQRRGLSPQQAHQAIVDEARKRFPSFNTIIVRAAPGGFEIIAVDA